MTEAIVFPVVEKLLVAYLAPLAGVPVTVRVPNPRPASFVKLVRVGGTRRDRITDEPMVVFQCWADTESNAAKLGARIQAHVFALEQTGTPDGYVRSVHEIGGLQYFPDPESGQPTYQFTAQLQTRGVPL